MDEVTHERQVDYHVHYHIDRCASDCMTLENIDAYAHRLGLTELTVLKHYSHAMPNGEAHWANWHRIIPAEFDAYLSDLGRFRSRHGIMIHSGAETELLNQAGDINIPPTAQDRLDMVALSMHHMIGLDALPLDAGCYPPNSTDADRGWLERWSERVNDVGPGAFVDGIVEANINAIRRFPKIRTLAHMHDGLYMLRDYRVPVDTLSDDELIGRMEPLMRCMAEHGVLWELQGRSVTRPAVLRRANELGVLFAATGDAHFLEGSPWGNFSDHTAAQQLIDSLGLRNGTIAFPAS